MRFSSSGQGTSTEVERHKGAAAAEAPTILKDDNSIEAILARSQRKELIERVGPDAVRYLPSEDPTALLLPDNRLQPAERKWQKVFVALPWLTFACMLAAPLLLVYGNLPFLQQRAERQRQAAAKRAPATAHVAGFEIVNFGQMPDVLERPFPTMLLLFHPATYACKVFLPALRDLEGLLRAHHLPVSVAALDLTAEPQPPKDFLWEYPAAVTPHLQMVLPRSMDGEAGVQDYEGQWSGRALAGAACRLAGPQAELPAEDLQHLELGIQRLRDLLFELLFLEEPEQEAQGWRQWFRREVPQMEAQRRQAVQEAEKSIDIGQGLDAAIASCEAALAKLRGPSA